MLTTATLERAMPDRSYVVAHLEARIAEQGETLVRGLSPAFSLTGEVFESHGNRSGKQRANHYARLIADGSVSYGPASEPETSGACHAEILKAFPHLKRFADMHLAHPITGEPLHAAANGWYWYAGSRADLRARERYTGFDHDRSFFARRRIPLSGDEVAECERHCYDAACRTLRVDYIPRELGHAGFLRFVDDQREGWRYDAMEARELVERLAAKQNTER